MPARLLLFFLCCSALLHAQAPGTATRGDIDGRYQRPDLTARIFDAAAAKLSPEQTDAIVRDLVLIARNFPDNIRITHRVRSRALAVALRLSPDDRAAVVANGQLARGMVPAPVPCDPPASLGGIAARLRDVAMPMIEAPENAARQLALLLLDLCTTLDPRLRREIAPLTYMVAPRWPESQPPAPAFVEPPRGFQLTEAAARVLMPGLKDGQLQILTVQARATPLEGKKGLRVVLPPALLQAMEAKGGEGLRAQVQGRMTALRAALRLRHESWPDGWAVEFSADGPPTALPQFFAGMALALDALLAGEPIDPSLLLAAGADEEGRLIPIMSPGELLPAAALTESAASIVLPRRAADDIADWLLLHPDQWPLLFRVTLHRTADLTDALSLSKQAHAAKLAQALAAFNEIAGRLRKAGDPLAELRKAETIAKLREIVAWHAGHLSASALLSVAEPAPSTLSLRASLARIDALAQPILSTDRKAFPLHKPKPVLEKSSFLKASEELQSAKLLNPGVRAYVGELVTLAKLLDRSCGSWNAYLKNNGPPDPPHVAAQRANAAAARAVLGPG